MRVDLKFSFTGIILLASVRAISLMAQTEPDFRTPPGAEWPLVGGDWSNTRYSPLSQINTTNVNTLKGGWMARLNSGFGPPYSQQGTPVVRDGVMYITTGQQDIFALDAKTGAQIWEYRSPADPRTPDNKAKRGVGIGEGMVFGVETDIRPLGVYILDRITGKPLLPIVERPVPQEPRQKTAATQPIPVGDPTAPQCAEPVKGMERGCMFTPFWTDTNIAQPSASGDWAPGAYDPETGYLYFATEVATRRFTTTGRRSPVGTREYGLITAIDSRTNKQVWQKEVPYPAGFGSGVLATGGGLIFHGGTDGFFRAFDSRTGAELWRFQTGFGADAPAATYEIDGEQYVAIAAGGSRDGLKEARGDLVWSFKLNGKLNPLNGPPAPRTVIQEEISSRPNGPGAQE